MNVNKTWVIIPDNQENYDELNPKRLNYTYLHGKLESDCGFDCYGFINCDLVLKPTSDIYIDDTQIVNGKYPCEYNNKKCTLFFWHDNMDRPHGLVVYDDDLESVIFAEKALKEFVIHI